MIKKVLGSIYYIFISLQIALIVFLGMRIYQKSNNVLGSHTVNTNSRELFEINQTDELKYFHEPKPGVSENSIEPWGKTEFIQTINDDTLNERYDYNTEKENTVFRIITIGDSHTYGAMVDTSDSYPERLEDKLNQELQCANIDKFEVVNLGVPGYDIRYSVERFAKRGVKYDPDLVLWLFVHNDFNEVSEYMNPYMDSMRKRMMAEGEREKWINQIYYRELKRAESRMKSEISDEDLLKYYKKTILTLDQYFAKDIIYFTPGAIDEKNKDILRDISKNERNKRYFSLPLYEKDAFFPEREVNKSAHPNAVGYNLIASDVYKYLLDNEIINCERI